MKKSAKLFSFLTFLVGAVAVGTGTSPAAAHTDLAVASPAVNQSSGGEVDFVDLVFTENVSEVEITVTDPSGEVLKGQVAVDHGQIIRYDLQEQLTDPGSYTVAYTMISFDLDFTERDFVFDYDPEATQPFRVGLDGTYENQTTANMVLSVVSTLVIVIAVLGAAVLLFLRFRQTKQRPAED